jgi:hypothetical protein
VAQSIWRYQSVPPKTVKSQASIPIIPDLEKRLDAHRCRSGNPTTGPIFANGNGTPFDLNKIYQLTMKSALKARGIEWHGWQAFRRGSASNLFELGCDDLTVQRILRHSRVQVNLNLIFSVTKAARSFRPNHVKGEDVRELVRVDAQPFYSGEGKAAKSGPTRNSARSRPSLKFLEDTVERFQRETGINAQNEGYEQNRARPGELVGATETKRGWIRTTFLPRG